MKKLNRTPVIISILMLLLAAFYRNIGILKLEYGYYTLLRFVVCGTSVYSALTAHFSRKRNLIWIFGFVAILFNPVVPIHFNKGTWRIIDFIVAIFYFYLIVSPYLFKKHGRK